MTIPQTTWKNGKGLGWRHRETILQVQHSFPGVTPCHVAATQHTFHVCRREGSPALPGHVGFCHPEHPPALLVQ